MNSLPNSKYPTAFFVGTNFITFNKLHKKQHPYFCFKKNIFIKNFYVFFRCFIKTTKLMGNNFIKLFYHDMELMTRFIKIAKKVVELTLITYCFAILI